MSATYTKLKSGNWGVRIEGAAQAGQTITVTKRDGSTKSETIERVVWSGNGVSLCAIRQSHYSCSTARYGSYSTIGQRQNERMRRTGWTGCSCGSIEGRPRSSDCASCQHDY